MEQKANDETAVLEKIVPKPEPYRGMGGRLHGLILHSAPALRPKEWPSMPGHAKDGPFNCFLRGGDVKA